MKFHADVVGCVLETTAVEAPFETGHEYLNEQYRDEVSKLFDGKECQISDQVPSVLVADINDSSAIEAVQNWQPEVTVAFGVRRLKTETINKLPGILLNLHGGDPEKYRGLDTHLWAIYHSDFDSLVTTLHVLVPRLDTGDIVEQRLIPLRKDMQLYELRAANTEVCIDLVKNAVDTLKNQGKLALIRQRESGRYYSFMPSVLKDQVKRRFEDFTGKLA
jgi:methionyl-tRNA formyltransferase